MKIKSFMQKDRYGNSMSVEFFEDNTIPSMMDIPTYDHPGDPKGTDTVPAWLTPGEYVVNAEATRKYEPLLEEINDEGKEMQAMQGGSVPTYQADGGPIYAQQGTYVMPDFLSDEALEPVIQGMYATETSSGANVRTSEDGAIGPMQILPSTAANPGYGVSSRTIQDISSLEGSQEFAKDYLRAIHRYNPDFNLEEVVTAYHSGPGNVRNAKNEVEPLGPRGQAYAGKVLANAELPVEPIEETSSGFSPINFILGIGNAEASTGEVPSISEEPPTPIYDFNSKIAESNLQNVEKEFREFEAKRLANLEAGRDEFYLINENTYNSYKDALEFQKQNVLEEREDLLPYLSPERSDFVLLSEEQRLAEEGIPSPEEVAVINSPEYQAMQSRARSSGGRPLSPEEFLDMQKRNAEDTIDPQASEAREEGDPLLNILNNTYSNSNLEKENDRDIRDAAEEGIVNKSLSFLKSIFSDYLDGEELARMAIIYAGSRGLGYDHESSLNYTTKQFVERQDQLYKNVVANKDNYTTTSYTKFLKSRNAADLIPVGPERKMGDFMYFRDFGLQQTIDLDGVPHLLVDHDGNPNTPDLAYNAIDLDGVKAKDSLHDRETVVTQFVSDIKEIERVANSGRNEKDKIPLDNRDAGLEAADLYFNFLQRYGADPANANKTKMAINRALKKWGEAVVAYGKTNEGTDPTKSLRVYFEAETIKQTVGISPTKIEGTDPQKLKTIVTYAEKNLQSSKALQAYFAELEQAFYRAKAAGETKWADKPGKGFNDFTFFINTLQNSKNDPNNRAVQLYNKYKTL